MRTPHATWPRTVFIAVAAAFAALLSGCAATSVLTFAYERANEGECVSASCAATAMLSYAIDKANEGEPTPCHKLNSVERALSTRCGVYQAGSLLTKDVTASGLPRCPLALAARDAALWPVLPELLSKGAMPEACDQPPLVALAQAMPCPDFASASPDSLQALRWLAEADTRTVHHDVVRMLSCPTARAVGLDNVLDGWLAQGLLPSRGLTFGVLSALHPDALDSRFAHSLEARGHRARDGLGATTGRLPSGFDLALKESNVAALDWWFDRVPELANRVPSRQGNQLAWMPLVRVLTPSYLDRPDTQAQLVSYLMSRGADPWKALPHDPGHNVVNYAQQVNSPSLALLETPPRTARTNVATKISAAAVNAAIP